MICNLCPRGCNALRGETVGQGRCRMPRGAMVARAALHHWEEPVISGTGGSGTVFFSGCALSCLYCQNEEISQQDFGKAVSERRLRSIFEALIEQGAHNINLVNPSHFAHVLAQALEQPLPVPVVWNSSGYDRVDTLRGLEGKIQIYLPDYKYRSPTFASEYSGAEDYPEVAQAAILEMVRQVGPMVIEGGLLRRGVLVRHLLLPGRLQEAKAVMDFVAEAFAPGTVGFSLMGQYLPWGRAVGHRELGRVLRPSELRSAQAYMENLGLVGYSQETRAADSCYIPAFDLTGV